MIAVKRQRVPESELQNLQKSMILRVGEVIGVEGRRVSVLVDKNKNTSELLFEGKLIRNISVGSFIEIRKGFLSLIGKIDGERVEEFDKNNQASKEETNPSLNIKRTLSISMIGYLKNDRFFRGITELPLIGNEAFILSDDQVCKVHNLLIDKKNSLKIDIAKTSHEDTPISLPIDGLFNSHIAIFGNTGSGKSNTLVSLYKAIFDNLDKNTKFKENCRFLFFDFNGELTEKECITENKIIYNLGFNEVHLNTKIPFTFKEFFDPESFSILVEATEKTQKPFIKRAINLYLTNKDDLLNFIKSSLESMLMKIFQMANKDIAFKLIDYIEEILNNSNLDKATLESLRDDFGFHSGSNCTFFYHATNSEKQYFDKHKDKIKETNLYRSVIQLDSKIFNNKSCLSIFYNFLLLALINDLYSYKVQNEHIYPLVNRFRSKKRSIEEIIDIQGSESKENDLWQKSNCVIVNLEGVSLEMRKTIPLLLAKKIYSEHKGFKRDKKEKTLNIIIDEAHNILSKTSFRETEDWKDYRLETFEEIIKEGRKFGVFVTISSQRPNDISDTIISQAHNYFIHQLVNEKDLLSIKNAVSYIDKLSEESIPTLSVGTCVFSGTAVQMPIKLNITELPDCNKPKSKTYEFKDVTTTNEESQNSS